MSEPPFVSSARGIAAGIAAMVVVVALSNYAVPFAINDWLTWGAFTYPAAFLVTDLTNRTLGPTAARRGPYASCAQAVSLATWLAVPLNDIPPGIPLQWASEWGAGRTGQSSEVTDD